MDRADMTHPLTPREKVRKAIINVMKPKDADITLGRIDTCTGAILTALASGSGDHAELVLMANAALEIYSDDVLVVGGTRRIHADNIILYVKNGVDALLAENAALRVLADDAAKHSMRQTDKLLAEHDRATEAERKLAEAVEILRAWLMQSCEDDQVLELQSRSRTFLSKEAERG